MRKEVNRGKPEIVVTGDIQAAVTEMAEEIFRKDLIGKSDHKMVDISNSIVTQWLKEYSTKNLSNTCTS